MKYLQRKKGFTLVELLIVMAIIIIIAGIILISINPVQRLAAARNAKRAGDVANIVNALWLKTYDDGQRITALDTVWRMLGESTENNCNVRCGDLSNGSLYHGLQTGMTGNDQVAFNGQDDVSLDTDHDWSLSFWILPGSMQNKYIVPVVGDMGGLFRGMGVFVFGESLSFVARAGVGESNGFIIDMGTLEPGEPAHIVITHHRDSVSHFAVYRNGELIDEKQTTLSIAAGDSRVFSIGGGYVELPEDSYLFIWFGLDPEDFSEYVSFNGVTDEVKLYDAVMQQEDVEAQYNIEDTITVSDDDLAHYWKLDEFEGITTVDEITGLQWVLSGSAVFTGQIPPQLMILPEGCVQVQDDIEGYLDAIPISPEANDFVPDADRTFYAARRGERELEVRACLTEDDGDNKPFPGIKARK